MKAIIRFVFCSVLFAIGTPMAAHADTKVAVMDVQRILTSSKAAQNIQDQIKTRRETFQEELSKRERSLADFQKEIAENKDVSKEDIQAKRDEFEKMLFETRKMVQDRQRALEKSANNAIKVLREEAIKIVADISDEQGYEMVVSRQNVILADKSLDITDQVLEKLNAKITEIDIDQADSE